MNNVVKHDRRQEGTVLQRIESAIRNALTKADSADPAMRQQIYESVWSAHERAMAANTALSEQQRADRRAKLKAAISNVEQEMRAGSNHTFASEPASPPPQYDGGLGVPELDNTEIRPRSQTLRKRRKAAQQDADLGYEPGLSHPAHTKKRKKSRLLSLALPLTFLAVAVFIGWSLYNSFVAVGPLNPLSEQTRGNIGPALQGHEADSKDWITIFTPSQPDRISVHGKAKAEIAGSDRARYARITSPGAQDTISFDIGEGVLSTLAGQQATIEVIASSDNGNTVQLSISCSPGALGDCGRKRYDVTDQRSSLLFDLNIPASSSGSGQLVLTSDINGTGQSVDIYTIRVKAAKPAGE